MKTARKIIASAAFSPRRVYYTNNTSAFRQCTTVAEECEIFFGCQAVLYFCSAGFCLVDCPCDWQDAETCDAH